MDQTIQTNVKGDRELIWEESVCDGCGSPGGEVLFSGPDLLMELPGEFHLVRCTACGLIRQNPWLAWESLKSYYPEDYSAYEPIIDRERLTGISSFYASPVAAAGRDYLVGRDGTTLVLKQSDKLEVLATNQLDDPIDASPAIVGKQLFLRGEKHLYCIEAK